MRNREHVIREGNVAAAVRAVCIACSRQRGCREGIQATSQLIFPVHAELVLDTQMCFVSLYVPFSSETECKVHKIQILVIRVVGTLAAVP